MALTNKLIITLLLLISISFVHCLSFHVEIDEFQPPQQEEQDVPRRGPGRGPGGGSSPGWEEQSTDHPYHFRKQSFKKWFKSKEGFLKGLPKFTERSPKIFSGIENYRFSLLEMEPTTFFVPRHYDAEAVIIVLQGKGAIEFVTEKTSKSFHITKGDVLRIPSGVTHFLTNTNQTVPLRVAKISVPVNGNGHFKDYFPAKSQFQQSYFKGFSRDVLSASFNIPEELIERLTPGSQQMGQGSIRRISLDQIKELTQHSSYPSKKHKSKKESHEEEAKTTIWSPFNIFKQDPAYSNNFGHFHEAHPEDFDQLRDLHIAASWLNMTQGSLFLPHFNSKTTFVAFVENGCARFEMASPYPFQGEQQQQQQWWPEQGGEQEDMSGQVHKVVSRVCKGEVFIIPAGHPFAIVSQDENFVSIGFGIHASNCTRTFLAGEENVLSNLNPVATRVTFGVGSKVAEKLFTSQNYSYFAPTSHSQQQFPEKRKPSFQSIFNIAGF